MKLIFMVLLFLVISFASFGQATTDTLKGPRVILIIDTIKIPLNDSQCGKVIVEWVEKIELVKDEKYKTLYGNKEPVIFLYIRKKYLRKAKRELGIK